MGVRSLLDFLFLAPDPLHGVFLSLLQLLDLLDVHGLHLDPEGLHFLPVAVGLLHPDSAQLEFFHSTYLSLQIILVARLALFFVLQHPLLEGLERSRPLDVLFLQVVVVDSLEFLV